MSLMLEEKDRIRELLASYCFHYDEARFDLWLDLWADNPVFDVDGRLFEGRADLEGFVKMAELVNGKPPMKHLCMNEIIAVNGETATSRCYLLVVRKAANGNLLTGSAGTYTDELVRKYGRWYFQKRICRRDLRFEPLLGK